MASNSFKINKSLNLNPQPGLPAGTPLDGDFFYDATAQTFAYYHNGAWANFDSVGAVAAQATMTGAQFLAAIVRNSVVRVTGTGIATNICGLAASFSGKMLSIYNATDQAIVVQHDSASELTVINRILTPISGNMNIVVGEIATFTYDIIQNRWLLVSISSQAGAQLPASTTNNGIVTLHRVSLTPSAPVVLCVEDLNAANGVVGLDANSAASITATGASTTALTLTGSGTGYGLQVSAGGIYMPAADISFVTSSQKIQWGATTYIVGDPNTSITMLFSTNSGISQFNIGRVSSTRIQLNLKAFTSFDCYIQLDTSITPIMRIGSDTANSSIIFTSAGADRWGIDPSGTLTSLSAGSGIIRTNTAAPLIFGVNGFSFWQVDSGAALESLSQGASVILRSPNNTRYAVTVTNAGALSVAPA